MELVAVCVLNDALRDADGFLAEHSVLEALLPIVNFRKEITKILPRGPDQSKLECRVSMYAPPRRALS